MPTLYTFGNTANVSANNFTTLYNSGAGVVNPQVAYGNANVQDFLAVGSDIGGNTVTNIIASGNITAQNFIGNIVGNLLIPGNTGEVVFNSSDLAGVSPNFVFNTGNATLTVTGGVVSGNFVGNGSQLSSITGANVTGTVANASQADSANLAIYVTGSAQGNITSVGTLTGLNVNGAVSASGNITGNYLFGNGSQLTGLPATYGNANVSAYLASGNINSNIVTTADVVANAIYFGSDVPTERITADDLTMEFYTNNQRRFQITSGGGNLQGNLVLNNTIGNGVLHAYGAYISGAVSASGNITGNYFFGNGSQLTGLPEIYGNANVATFLANFGSNSISTAGNITANNLSTLGNVTISGTLNSDDITSSNVTVYGDQVITGNLTVQGTTTTINSNVVTINDKTITVANNQSTGANVNGAGLEVGNAAIATWYYNDPTASWQSNISITPTGNLVQDLGKSTNQWATIYGGNVSAVGNVTAGNVATAGLVSAAGNVQGAFIIGDGTYLSNVTATTTIGGASLVYLPVKNTTAGTLDKGTPVYATGTVGSGTTLEVAASRADTPSTMAAIGLLETALAAGATGNAASIGTITNIDTSTYALGQQLYVAPTGGITNTRPTGANVVQSVGTVGRVNSSTGSITVNIWDQNPLPNLGSGNIWVGNASAFPTQTTLSSYTGNIGAGNISVSGNVNSGNVIASGLISATGNVRGGNINTLGLITATGNVTGGNLVTSGYVVTNTGLTFGALSSRITELSNTISIFTENTLKISIANAGVNIANANLNVSTNAAVTGNASAGNITTTGLISATGNITGAYFIGNGSQLTGLPASYSNANVSTYLASGTNSANIITTANIAGGNITTTGLVSATGNITGNYIIGNGSQLTGLPAGYSNTDVSTYLASGVNTANIITSGNVSGAFILGNGSALTSITGANVTGTVASATTATTANTVIDNAQPNITSVGTLTSVSVTGNAAVGNILTVGLVSATGNVTGNYIFGNGAFLTGISGGGGGSYGNANVASYLSSGTVSTDIITTANVTAGGVVSAAGNLISSGVRTEFTGLNKFTQFNYTTSATGSITIDKVNGQNQIITPTGNITISGYANLVTSVTSGTTYPLMDTLTITIAQSNPAYIVTMPSGSTYKYAGNVRTIGNTANAVTMISVTAANVNGTVTYLTTISPEFV